jgi:hypothetical protein
MMVVVVGTAVIVTVGDLLGLLGPVERLGAEVGMRTTTIVSGALFLGLSTLMLLLALLRLFANRACVIEDRNVISSYRRGTSVLLHHAAPALVLLLGQIGASVVLGTVMILLGILASLCCALWPLLLLINGATAAFFCTLWTLTWHEWTDTTIPAS